MLPPIEAFNPFDRPQFHSRNKVKLQQTPTLIQCQTFPQELQSNYSNMEAYDIHEIELKES